MFCLEEVWEEGHVPPVPNPGSAYVVMCPPLRRENGRNRRVALNSDKCRVIDVKTLRLNHAQNDQGCVRF
jgi:hypothetical protein